MNKRLKSLDIARVSMASSYRASARYGDQGPTSPQTTGDRQKTARLGSARYTRHGLPQQLKQQQMFRIRNSLADLVKNELDGYDRCTFYQRVFILTKNAIMTESVDSSVTSILEKYMQSKTNLNENIQPEEEQSQDQAEDEGESEFGEEDVDQKTEADSRVSERESKVLRESQLLQITKSDIKIAYKEKRYRELDFFDFFHKKVENIVKKCEYEQLSDDRFSGLLLCMGNSHSLIVLEGTEDSIATFCQELLLTCSDCLESTRVFLVEDRIEETYFNDFLYRRTVAMNINEKFPPPTANDPQLMGSQHWLIKEKLRTLCMILSEELKPKVVAEGARMTEAHLVIKEEEAEERTPRKRKHKRRRKKSPKREESPTTVVEEEEKGEEEEDDGLSRRGTSASIRFKSQRAESSMVRKSIEPSNETESRVSEAAMPRKSNILKETLKHLEEKISTTEIQDSEKEKDDEISAEPLNPFTLNPQTYVRLLPEVQRIELVLTSKRFYLELDEFIRFSNEIPMQEDEDAMIWPTSFSYLPLNIFDRLPFDVNLTFGNYDANDAAVEESSSSDGEGK